MLFLPVDVISSSILWLFTDLKGILGEAEGRGWDQLDRADSARSGSCAANHVYDCNVNLIQEDPDLLMENENCYTGLFGV